jgi:hypothetical protein
VRVLFAILARYQADRPGGFDVAIMGDGANPAGIWRTITAGLRQRWLLPVASGCEAKFLDALRASAVLMSAATDVLCEALKALATKRPALPLTQCSGSAGTLGVVTNSSAARADSPAQRMTITSPHEVLSRLAERFEAMQLKVFVRHWQRQRIDYLGARDQIIVAGCAPPEVFIWAATGGYTRHRNRSGMGQP